MTPEEAIALEPGTTDGPWEHDDVPGPGEDPTRATEVYPQDESGVIAYVQPNAADVALIAAAPDMRATIAAQTWEYGVEVRADEDSEWLRIGPWWPTVEKARAYRGHAILRLGTPYSHDRVIRRMVSPVEVVDK